ncbi:NAD(+)/NADH kinase [Cryptobacterium curtum]
MRILIMRNAESPAAIDASLMLGAYLSSQDIEFTLADAADPEGIIASSFDMAVALGGDGTILRTAKMIRYSRVPILGINYGHLGFLANGNQGGVVAASAAALAGDTVAEERTNLRIFVQCEGDDDDQYESMCAGDADASIDDDFAISRCLFALNETALTRGALGWMIDCELSISGSLVGTVRGDGMVISTATGSTAYALSAGGPLVAPNFRGLVVVPVAPHSLIARAVVTDPHDIVELTLGDTRGDHEAQLFVDGLAVEFPAPIKRLRVQRGPEPTILLRYQGESFYTLLRTTFFEHTEPVD